VKYVAALGEALDLQAHVYAQVSPSNLDLHSACSEWSIGEVMAHSLGVTLKFVDFAMGATDRPHSPGGDLLGVDHRSTFARLAGQSRLAWLSADMGRSCYLRFGVYSADLAAGINLFDVLAHTSDVAGPSGVDLPGRDRLWEVGLDAARVIVGRAADPDHFAPALAADETDPPQVRFLRFLGRDAQRTSTRSSRPARGTAGPGDKCDADLPSVRSRRGKVVSPSAGVVPP
jgi:uncharacterized protein (TIGR03086 family)